MQSDRAASLGGYYTVALCMPPIVMSPLVLCLPICSPSGSPALGHDAGPRYARYNTNFSVVHYRSLVGWLGESAKLGEARRGETVVVDLGDRSARDSSVADLCMDVDVADLISSRTLSPSFFCSKIIRPL